MNVKNITLFVYISILSFLCVYIYSRRTDKRYDIPPLRSQCLLEYICINLPYRRNKFDTMSRTFRSKGLHIQAFDGVDGKNLNIDLYTKNTLSPDYKEYIQSNPTQRGHLGATFSHLGILQLIMDQQKSRTVVLEDDCETDNDFQNRLNIALEYMDLIDPTGS